MEMQDMRRAAALQQSVWRSGSMTQEFYTVLIHTFHDESSTGSFTDVGVAYTIWLFKQKL